MERGTTYPERHVPSQCSSVAPAENTYPFSTVSLVLSKTVLVSNCIAQQFCSLGMLLSVVEYENFA
jgi:hypothetical protein